MNEYQQVLHSQTTRHCTVCGRPEDDHPMRSQFTHAFTPRHVDQPASQKTTGLARHIATPRPQAAGRPNLCGAPQEVGMSYNGLDEAYIANIEGWAGGPPCRDCLKVALIAMGISP